MTKLSKNAKYHIFEPVLPKFGQKWIFNKNQALLLFSIYSPLTPCKKSEKTNEPILGKNLKRWTN